MVRLCRKSLRGTADLTVRFYEMEALVNGEILKSSRKWGWRV